MAFEGEGENPIFFDDDAERNGPGGLNLQLSQTEWFGGTTIVFYNSYPLMDIITVWWDPFKGMISWTNYNMEMVCSWKLLAKNTIA